MAAMPTLYRGRSGMWMWLAHRVTGVAIFFYLLVHVLDTALVGLNPAGYNEMVETYKSPFFGLLEAGVVGALLFHAFNGLRVIAIDATRWGARRQGLLTGVVVGLWAVLMIGFLYRHLGHVFGGS